MNYRNKAKSVRIIASLLIVSTMLLGAFVGITSTVKAQVEDARFIGNVTVDGSPSDETLVMYGFHEDEMPSTNSTQTDINGDYEIWVESDETYDIYFANGAAMFDESSVSENHYIGPGQTIVVDADLNPAPPRTVTIRGYITNASNASEPVTTGHVLGLRMDIMMGGDGPNYINWSTTNSTGYYEMNMLSGALGIAVFDADGYLPGMTDFETDMLMLSDGESGWLNLSLIPLSAANITVSGRVREAMTPNPIAGATVEIRMYGIPFGDQNVTDLGGFYELTTLRGTGMMTVSAIGYATLMEYDVDVSGNITKDFDLYPNNARIWGYILDELTLNPVPNASIEANQWLMGNQELYNETMSAQDGYYEMNLSDGGWDIWVEAEGYGPNGTWRFLNPSDDIRIDILLPPENSVFKGYVLDKETGLPIDNAMVRIEDSWWGENSTRTNESGYYEMNCQEESYQIMFFADGYMAEVLIGPWIEIGPGETKWVNNTLDPANTTLYGTATDAVSSLPIDSVEIMVASITEDPDYARIAQSWTDMDGNYSVTISANPTTIFQASHADYEFYFEIVNIPSVPSFEYNFAMIPLNASDYTLIGYVNDSMTGMPIAWADITAYYGLEWINGTMANAIGYYEMQLPVVTLDVTARNPGHLPDTDIVLPGAPGERVWHNFTLDSHSEYPVVAAYAVPDENVSIVNHADVYANITESYLENVGLAICRIVNMNWEYAYLYELDQFWFNPDFFFWSDMDGSEVAPGIWEVGIWDWDTRARSHEDVLHIKDTTGEMILTTNFWYDSWMDQYSAWGQYENSSLGAPIGADAVFDSSGVLLGIDFGGGPDQWAANDPTGIYWQDMWCIQYNLSTNQRDGMVWNTTPTLWTASMYLEDAGDPIRYPSGNYAALFEVYDEAWLQTMNISIFMIDNDPPVADAGMGQTEYLDTPVTLDGSGSSDNVGITNYTWEFMDGGTPVTLYGEIVQYTFSTAGNYSILLTVQDGAGFSDTNMTYVEAIVDTEPPVADAGPDQSVDEDTIVTFNGSGSSDNNGYWGIVNYTWTFIDGSPQTLYGVSPTYNFTEPGSYNVTLTVMDFVGLTNDTNVTITVNDTTAPIADAGPDRNANRDTSMTFDGSGSTDNVEVVNYTWNFTDGGPQTLYDMNPSYTFTTVGVYNVTLNVTDAAGNWDVDYVIITVIVDSTPPVADAGPDQTVDEDSLVAFDGSNSYDNVGIDNYTWTFDDGGLQTLYGVGPTYTFATPGIYNVTLNVTDAAALWNTSYVIITVVDITPPTADAGEDQSVDAGEEVTFDGSGSTDNVGISTYSWSFDDDGTPVTLSGVSPTFTFTSAGTYTVTLNVTDAAGNWDTDTVSIEVLADTTPPVADAGEDQSVLVGDTVTFDASDSTDNVGIVNYTWVFTVDGDEIERYGVTFTYVFDEAGEYDVTLTVRDAAGLTDTDTITITVDEAQEDALSAFLSDYWWLLLLIIAIIAAIIAAYMIMKKGKGEKKPPAAESEQTQVKEEKAPPVSEEDLPPPPDD